MTPAEARAWGRELGGVEIPLGLAPGVLEEVLRTLEALRTRLHLTYGQRRVLEDAEELLREFLRKEEPWE
ncbi:MAG: hypothetical protein ABDH20_10630 [Thermus sp.]